MSCFSRVLATVSVLCYVTPDGKCLCFIAVFILRIIRGLKSLEYHLYVDKLMKMRLRSGAL